MRCDGLTVERKIELVDDALAQLAADVGNNLARARMACLIADGLGTPRPDAWLESALESAARYPVARDRLMAVREELMAGA